MQTLPNLPSDGVPIGKDEHANREEKAWGEQPEVRLSRQAPLGAGRSPRHPRLQPRRQDLRLALRRPLRPGSAPRARPRQLHARPPHPRARLHRGSAALHGQLEVSLRHRPAAEVRRRPLPLRRQGNRTSPATIRTTTTGSSPPPRSPSPISSATRRSTRPSFPSPTAPTRPAFAPRPAPTARTSAA